MDSDLSLGEDNLSYGFGGTGRAATNKQFKLYGEAYGPGDYIGCFIVSRLICNGVTEPFTIVCC